MAGPDLNIDFGALDRAKSDMAVTADTLRRAQRVGDDLADLTGHARLAGKVRDFAANWDDHRARLLKGLEHLQDSITAIEETFTEVDRTLGQHAGMGSTLP